MSRAKLKKIQRQIKQVGQEQNNLYKKLTALYKESVKAGFEVVKKEGLLAKYSWKIETESNNTFALSGKWVGETMPEVQKLLANHIDNFYHYSVEIEPGVQLHFADAEAELIFDYADDVSDFIKTWKIKVDTNPLMNDLEKCRNKIAKIERLARYLLDK